MLVLIGLLSDTHVPDHAQKLPDKLKDVFRGVDLILHGGDIYVPRVLDELEKIAPVRAAWGDDDLKTDLGTDTRMTTERTLVLEGVTIWLVHVRPSYQIICPEAEDNPSPAMVEASRNHPAVVISGHLHRASVERYKDVLLVNPGSATFPDYVSKPGTVALLSINSGKVEAKVIQL